MTQSLERPLSPWAKTGLIVSMLTMVAVFYLFALFTGVALGVLVMGEIILILAMARFGLAGWVARYAEAHLRLVVILLRSLWIKKNDVEYRIALQERDAPALFEMIRELAARLKVAPPDEVQLEMAVNAWVHLKGFRSGGGKTRLGIGFDLLAGLTISEIAGVLAHELTHAKLVQRGFKHFANGTLIRCGNLVRALSIEVERGRQQNQGREIGGAILRTADALIRTLAGFVSAYSRQDEFEADRGAAQICGSDAVRSSLLKMDSLAESARRLPWRERVARMQSGQSYSEWFLGELRSGLQESPANGEESAHVFDRYSTHPALQDRIAALPPDVQHESNAAPAVSLLTDPDATVQRLIEEIQRVVALQEEKDSKTLAKWSRKLGSSTRTQPAQWTAIVLCIILCFTIYLAPIGIILGVVLYRRGRYRDRLTLPIPEYAQLVSAGPKLEFEQQERIETEFRQAVSSERRRKRRALLLAQKSYDMLAQRDYLRAHVAARCCFKEDSKSIEGHIALVIAAAGLNQGDIAGQALRFVRYNTGFRTESSMWGAVWALILLHDWASAEAILVNLLRKKPKEKTLLCLLALVRSKRGKTSSAIEKARQACTPAPRSTEEARLLVSLLIDAGLLREAASRAATFEAMASDDEGFQFQMVRLRLLTHSIADADAWSNRILQRDQAHNLIGLAHVYLQARQFERAANFFSESLQRGHFPEALVGLASIEMERKNNGTAREFLLQAMNIKTPLAEGAVGPLQLFLQIVGRLRAMEPVSECRAWIATIIAQANANQAFLNTSYLVFAPSVEAAKAWFANIMKAMTSEFPLAGVAWQEARRDQQPARPVRPGIQSVFTTDAGASRRR